MLEISNDAGLKLLWLKNSLEASQYTAISKTTRTYKTEKNYDVLVASLKNIFLQGSLHMPQLFRGIAF